MARLLLLSKGTYLLMTSTGKEHINAHLRGKENLERVVTSITRRIFQTFSFP